VPFDAIWTSTSVAVGSSVGGGGPGSSPGLYPFLFVGEEIGGIFAIQPFLDPMNFGSSTGASVVLEPDVYEHDIFHLELGSCERGGPSNDL
jgi:hypothetical protein